MLTFEQVRKGVVAFVQNFGSENWEFRTLWKRWAA